MENTNEFYRVWAEVDLDRLLLNYDEMKTAAEGHDIMPVVKADAYGHGAVQVAKTLQAKRGVNRFAVVTMEEALLLRKAGIQGLILLMGLVPPAGIPALQKADVSVCVPSVQTARAYAKAAGERALHIHVKLDTGMSRLGLSEEEAEADMREILLCKPLVVQGVFTQLSSSDLPGEDAFTREQYRCFCRVTEKLRESGIHIPLRHCANSAATMGFDCLYEDVVRNGLSLYGYQSREEELGHKLHPILSWHSSIVQCKAVKKGASIGYDRGFRAPQDMRIATLPVGYADGYLRAFSKNGGAVLVRGQKAPLVGNVCMDMCMVDITAIENAAVGDVATLLGESGALCLSAEDLAKTLGTISYEVLCQIGKRVPRLYRENGKLRQDTPYWSGYFDDSLGV